MKMRKYIQIVGFVLSLISAGTIFAEDYSPNPYLPKVNKRIVKAEEVVKDNMATLTFRYDDWIVERIELYPAEPAAGEVVYAVSYWENVSQETIPVCNLWVGFFKKFPKGIYGFANYFGTGSSAFKVPMKPLNPGEKRLRWFFMDQHFLGKEYSDGNLSWEYGFPQESEYSILYKRDVLNVYPFSYSGVRYGDRHYIDNTLCKGEKEVVREFKNTYNRYTGRILEELPLIEKWCTTASDNVYDGYINNFMPGGDENLLKNPSTARDEIQLTRLIYEFIDSSETEEDAKIEAVVDFVESKPWAQKFVMTHRLYRVGEDFERFYRARWNKFDLPKGVKKLKKLETRLCQVREKMMVK